jgi:hypothetical protein
MNLTEKGSVFHSRIRSGSGLNVSPFKGLDLKEGQEERGVVKKKHWWQFYEQLNTFFFMEEYKNGNNHDSLEG